MTRSPLTAAPDDPTETTHQPVEIIQCDTLDQFWNVMSPIGEYFGQPYSQSIFRGQGNSEWQLVPKVFRHDVIDMYKRGMMSTLRDHPGQCVFEWSLLYGFVRYSDARGLAIPNDSMEFRRYFEQNNFTKNHGISSNSWPEEKVIPLMALAQHHGIPTRLLDWSSNPYVACYHAAASAVTTSRKCLLRREKIALFSIDLNYITRVNDIKPVRVPGSTSANLSSQAGSFILVNNSGSRGDRFTPDVSVESKLPPNIKVLKKITLPALLAGDLLLRCDRFGVSAASMFPGYDGAAKAVLELTLASYFNK